MHRDIIIQVYHHLNEYGENFKDLASSLEPFLHEQYSPGAIEEIENIDHEIARLEQELQNFKILLNEHLP